MFKNLFNFGSAKIPDYSLQINFVIDLFLLGFEQLLANWDAGQNEEADEHIYQAAWSFIGEEELTNKVYVFIPVALTRLWYEGQPFGLADHYQRIYPDGSSELIELQSMAVYRQIEKVLRARLPVFSDEDAFKILVHSSEYKLIERAIEQGATITRMSPPTTGA